MTIPTDVTPGYYCVGVMVDPYDTRWETDESNNATYIAEVYVW